MEVKDKHAQRLTTVSLSFTDGKAIIGYAILHSFMEIIKFDGTIVGLIN